MQVEKKWFYVLRPADVPRPLRLLLPYLGTHKCWRIGCARYLCLGIVQSIIFIPLPILIAYYAVADKQGVGCLTRAHAHNETHSQRPISPSVAHSGWAVGGFVLPPPSPLPPPSSPSHSLPPPLPPSRHSSRLRAWRWGTASHLIGGDARSSRCLVAEYVDLDADLVRSDLRDHPHDPVHPRRPPGLVDAGGPDGFGRLRMCPGGYIICMCREVTHVPGGYASLARGHAHAARGLMARQRSHQQSLVRGHADVLLHRVLAPQHNYDRVVATMSTHPKPLPRLGYRIINCFKLLF